MRVHLLLSALIRVHPRAAVVLFIFLDAWRSKPLRAALCNLPASAFRLYPFSDLSEKRFPHFLAIHAQSGQRPLLRIYFASLCGSAVNSYPFSFACIGSLHLAGCSEIKAVPRLSPRPPHLRVSFQNPSSSASLRVPPRPSASLRVSSRPSLLCGELLATL
jgi:hypothetical protein